ncbi:MAG: Crp/Fnr family transcriptional regulator [Rhizomicrobium sp.]
MPEIDDGKPPVSCADCALGRYALYGPTRDVSPQDISVRRRGILNFSAQKTFLREGDILTQMFTLYSGWAFCFKLLTDGRRQILSFLLPGDPIIIEGLCFPDEPLPYSVKGLTDIYVCAFDLNEMIELTNSSAAQNKSVAKAMRRHVTTLNRRMVDIGRRSAIGRVAQLILEIEGRLSERGQVRDGAFHFPVRQEHLADALGLTTVYVNRTLDRLRKEGVIDFERDRMKIIDRALLLQTAEEE